MRPQIVASVRRRFYSLGPVVSVLVLVLLTVTGKRW